MVQYVSLNNFFDGAKFVWKNVLQNLSHKRGTREEPVEASFSFLKKSSKKQLRLHGYFSCEAVFLVDIWQGFWRSQR
jgi:hypothetical protein